MIIRKLLLGASIAAVASSAAFAADLIIPTTPQPIMQTSSGFDWEGLYIGARAGALFADDVTVGAVGAVAGVNFIPADPILAGRHPMLSGRRATAEEVAAAIAHLASPEAGSTTGTAYLMDGGAAA